MAINVGTLDAQCSLTGMFEILWKPRSKISNRDVQVFDRTSIF